MHGMQLSQLSCSIIIAIRVINCFLRVHFMQWTQFGLFISPEVRSPLFGLHKHKLKFLVNDICPAYSKKTLNQSKVTKLSMKVQNLQLTILNERLLFMRLSYEKKRYKNKWLLPVMALFRICWYWYRTIEQYLPSKLTETLLRNFNVHDTLKVPEFFGHSVLRQWNPGANQIL